MKTIFRYSISYGLQGCYMPDSVSGPYIGTTRRELTDLIRDTLQLYGMPASHIRQIKINRIWAHIKQHGSSSAHFYFQDRCNALSFHGLTEQEAIECEAQQD